MTEVLPRRPRQPRHLGNLATTSPWHLGSKAFILFITFGYLGYSCRQMLKAVIFDFGHTIMPETLNLEGCLVELMPGVFEAMSQITLPKGIWTNTRETVASEIRSWLKRAGLDAYIQWVVTSFEIGHRKPSLEFFRSALVQCRLRASEVVFVGNQLNTDIFGATNAGIRSVYLADARYRSADDSLDTQVIPTYTIETLFDLPRLIQSLD